jgi:hypothetical protein
MKPLGNTGGALGNTGGFGNTSFGNTGGSGGFGSDSIGFTPGGAIGFAPGGAIGNTGGGFGNTAFRSAGGATASPQPKRPDPKDYMFSNLKAETKVKEPGYGHRLYIILYSPFAPVNGGSCALGRGRLRLAWLRATITAQNASSCSRDGNQAQAVAAAAAAADWVRMVGSVYVRRRTRGRSVNGQQFIIEDCEDCDLYVFDDNAAVTIDECKNCRIFIGPCDSSIFIRDCYNCKLVFFCRQFR